MDLLNAFMRRVLYPFCMGEPHTEAGDTRSPVIRLAYSDRKRIPEAVLTDPDACDPPRYIQNAIHETRRAARYASMTDPERTAWLLKPLTLRIPHPQIPPRTRAPMGPKFKYPSPARVMRNPPISSQS